MSSSEEVREAARHLLSGRFVTGPAATLVRRHRRELAQQFRDDFGWQVVADDHGPVRALCIPGVGHVPRGLTSRSGRPFDPLRYTLLFLVLAGLEASGARTTLTVLFNDVHQRAAGIDGVDFDRDQAAHRRAFVHAVQAVADLGVLEFADGNEEAFASSGDGDALYRVQRGHLTRILATSKPPSLSASPTVATAEAHTSTDDGERRRRRHQVTRALVAEPVVYRDDLASGELEYLTSQESRLRKVLDERFGLTLETRAEGWVAVDGEGTLTDERFPAISASRAAALAIVDASRSRRTPAGTATWTAGELREFIGGLSAQFGASWPVDPGDDAGVERITNEAISVLVATRLARPAPADGPPVDPDQGHEAPTTPVLDTAGICVLPAAGRFSLIAPSSSVASNVPLDAPGAPA